MNQPEEQLLSQIRDRKQSSQEIKDQWRLRKKEEELRKKNPVFSVSDSSLEMRRLRCGVRSGEKCEIVASESININTAIRPIVEVILSIMMRDC